MQLHLKFKHNFFVFLSPVDGTFCQAALQTKINIKEQLPKYLDGSIQLCILILFNMVLYINSDICILEIWAIPWSCIIIIHVCTCYLLAQGRSV